jgi:hypothetical protein
MQIGLELQRPVRLVINTLGKYPEIARYEFR